MGNLVVAYSLDLRKAFDTVNHEILIKIKKTGTLWDSRFYAKLI